LDLKDPDHATTDLGTVSVGGHASRTVPIINRSSKSVKFRITAENQEAFDKAFLTMSPDDRVVVTKNKDGEEKRVQPEMHTLRPKETFPIEIKFRPKVRLPNFEQGIMIEIEGLDQPKKLFTLRGVAHGIELKIMDEVISFGQVVKDSRLTKSL